jgi:hypothetical protein
MRFYQVAKNKKNPVVDPRLKICLARLALERANASPEDNLIWRPHPDNVPQNAACTSQANIVGYGGAAGGGKTDLAIGLACTQHTKSIIFRREYPQVKDIIKRAKEITEGYRVSFNGNDGMMTLPKGKTIEFGSMKDPDDWEKYKGRPHDLKAYDEATEILETQFRRSAAWLRTVDPTQRTRILLTFNPPTNSNGMWVIRFFSAWLDKNHPDPAKPGELRWYATIEGKEDVECTSGEPFYHDNQLIEPISRTFFPARLADNIYLMQTSYGKTLNALPEPLRSQLLLGSFEANMWPDPWQAIPSAWIDAAVERWKAFVALLGGNSISKAAGPMTCLGVDIAHGGKDSTVLAPRYGDFIDTLAKYEGRLTPDGMSAARLVADVLRQNPSAWANVDLIGWGASAHERLADSPPEGYGLPVQGISFAHKSEHFDKSGRFRMTNMRAEAYWRLREELDPDNDPKLMLPPDNELKIELTQPQYEIGTTGIRIESKEVIKERLGRSPDAADAVALTMLPNGQPYGPEVAGPIQGMEPVPTTIPDAPAQGIPGSLGNRKGKW